MTAISVKNLCKTFEITKKAEGLRQSFKYLFNPQKSKLEAVKDISFEIKKGEFVGFLGPNGAGKTTTLKMLSGILSRDSGEVSILGYDPADRKNDYKRRISMVMGQKGQLWWDLPPMETFLLNRDIYDIPEQEFRHNLGRLSKMLQIDSKLDSPVRKLSLGQRMKCELIVALLHSPEVLFLDEPTIGLDVSSQKVMREFLTNYNQETGATIILTSHYMEDVESLCKRIMVINHGSLVFDGSLRKLIEAVPFKRMELRLDGSYTYNQLAKYGKIIRFKPSKAILEIERNSASKILKQLLNEINITDVSIHNPEAADVIDELYQVKHETIS
jgi:ABC-2 type transport system ATP-binding protein